jgi:hypothetical protein
MSENKAETVIKNLPNIKNAKKYWPKELKEAIYDTVVDIEKDKDGRTVYVKTEDAAKHLSENFVGYGRDGGVSTVMKTSITADKHPWTCVDHFGPKGKYKFNLFDNSYVLSSQHNNSFDTGVIAKYCEEPAFEISNTVDDNSANTAAEIKVRDIKGRLILSQNKKGDYTTYTYLQDTCAVTDYANTQVNIRLCKENKKVQIYDMVQTAVHYEYKEHDPNYCNDIVPKYACETENGVLVKEYFFDMDSIGSFVHVIDYKNNEEYWRERNQTQKYPEQGNAHPSNFFTMGGLKFNNKDEYETFRNNKVDEMKVKEKAQEMLTAHGPRHFGPMMCGPWF